MSKKENIEHPTDAQIDNWKEQYGTVYSIEVAEEPEKFEPGTIPVDFDELPKLTGWLRKPDRAILNYAMTTMNKNMITAGKALLKNAWLGGDKRLLDDEEYSATAALEAVALVDMYQARLKKL